MLNCKKACALLSQAQDRVLTRRERWALRLHLMLCRHCRRYRRQLDFVRRSVRAWRDGV